MQPERMLIVTSESGNDVTFYSLNERETLNISYKPGMRYIIEEESSVSHKDIMVLKDKGSLYVWFYGDRNNPAFVIDNVDKNADVSLLQSRGADGALYAYESWSQSSTNDTVIASPGSKISGYTGPLLSDSDREFVDEAPLQAAGSPDPQWFVKPLSALALGGMLYAAIKYTREKHHKHKSDSSDDNQERDKTVEAIVSDEENAQNLNTATASSPTVGHEEHGTLSPVTPVPLFIKEDNCDAAHMMLANDSALHSDDENKCDTLQWQTDILMSVPTNEIAFSSDKDYVLPHPHMEGDECPQISHADGSDFASQDDEWVTAIGIL